MLSVSRALWGIAQHEDHFNVRMNATHFARQLDTIHPSGQNNITKQQVDISAVTVRRHIIWNNLRPDLKEDLAHLVQDIKRRIRGIASAGSPSFSV
jgi:hypothetical protein